MAKKFLVAFIVLVAFVLVPFAVYADDAMDMAGKFSVGLASGGVFPKDSDIDNTWWW